MLASLAWLVLVLPGAWLIKAARGPDSIGDEWPSNGTYQALLLGVWGLLAAWFWSRCRSQPEVRQLTDTLRALAGSLLLALGIGAAQFLPVMEFVGRSDRATGSSAGDLYAFSLEPYRAVEWAWPGFFGSHRQAQRSWIHLVPPRHLAKPWVPSLYLGGLTLVLALRGAGWRGGPPWRAGMTAIAAASLLGALGEFGSPVWWARAIPGVSTVLGAHEPSIYEPPRTDGGVADGFGSPYWLLTTVLPGFRLFRYPGKLLIFTTLALSALAGVGWDRWRAGQGSRSPGGFLAVSVLTWTFVTVLHEPIVRLLHAAGGNDPATAFNARGATADLQRALLHGSIVLACALAILRAAGQGRRWAGPSALIVLTADLAVANASLPITVPQDLFDREPAIARQIAEAERREPSPGPFRIYRMTPWYPPGLFQHPATDLHLQATRWERDTLKPKFGLAPGLAYTLTPGTLSRRDYDLFFASFDLPLDIRRAPLQGARDRQLIRYYARRGFDLWGTRYFILPFDPAGWQDSARGFASFLPDTEVIAPQPSALAGPDSANKFAAWIRDHDWQLLRNRAAFPRAWVVHQARLLAPLASRSEDELGQLIGQILYADDPLWSDPGRPVYDPRRFAWIETNDPRSLRRYLPRTPPDPAETVTIRRHDPQRVEIEARLQAPGIVLLADVHAPGWSLTIDGQAAPILRANHLMRGAAVLAGTHHLVYTYDPLSFRVGGYLSLSSLALVLVLLILPRRLARSPIPPDSSGSENPPVPEKG